MHSKRVVCPILWRVSDDGPSRRCSWRRGRRPKASSEGKPRLGERAAVPRALTYQDLTVVAAIRQHNFCVMARKLRLVENDFGILCSFNELRVVKILHISTSTLYTSRRPLYHIG